MEEPEKRSATVAELVEYIRQGEQQRVISILLQQHNIKKQKNFHNVVRAAVETAGEAIIVWLLEDGYNKNELLDIAINNGNARVITLILDKGADKEEGLYFAIKANNTDAITLLLKLGAKINSDKRNGNTPLHAAIIQKCNLEVVKLLIEKGADTNLRTKKNKTALDLVTNFLASKIDALTIKKLKEIEGLLKLYKLNDNVFECLQGLPDGLSGYTYQIKLLTLYAIVNTKLAISTDYKYELGTEVTDLVPFDDIYLKQTQNGRIYCQFGQVKQTKKPKLNQIKESNFFTILKSGENMKEYLKGNDTIVKMFIKFDEIMTSDRLKGASGDFVYCTNTTFESPPIMFALRDNDDFLCGVGGEKWQISDWRYLDSELKYALFNLLVGAKYTKKMSNEFKNDIREQIKILEKFKFELIKENDENKMWTLLKIAKIGLEMVNGHLELLEHTKTGIKSAIAVETIESITPNDCKLPHYMGDISCVMNSAITKIDEVSKSLKNDKELFLYFSKWDDVTTKNKINNFIQHFCIYTACPTSEELDDIITQEISVVFKFHKSRLLCFYCVQYFSKWISDFKNKCGNLFTDADGKKLFHDLRVQIFKGFSKSYTEDLQAYNVHFKNNNTAVIDFIKYNKNTILHVITEYPHLHALQVQQTLIHMENDTPEYGIDSILFTSSEFILRDAEAVQHFFEAFSSSSNTNDLVLVIAISEYLRGDADPNKIFNKLRSISHKKGKRIIVISKSDDKLATALKYMFTDHVCHSDTIAFKDLSNDSQVRILNKTVDFQNDPFYSKESKKLLDFLSVSAACNIISEEMLSIIITSVECIQVGNVRAFYSDKYNKEYYIPRLVHPQSIESSNLRYSQDNLFFITGISKKELISKANVLDDVIHLWQEDKYFENGIILIPETEINITSDNIFIRIANKCNTNFRWLDFQDGLFFLKAIKTNLQENEHIYLEVSKMDKATLDKHSMLPENLSDKIVILANNPGEGKSTMLTDLAYAMKKKSTEKENSELWIVRVDLKEFVDIHMPTSLNNINFNSTETVKAVNTIVRMVVGGDDSLISVKLERVLLEASLNGYGKTKVAMLFDGFDEISPDYKDKTCTLLKALKNSNIQQIWVTTRVHLKGCLEDELEQPAYVLNPLTKQQQVDFLNKYWKWKLKNYADPDCETEGDICEQILRNLKVCYDNYYNHSNTCNLESLINIISKNSEYTLKSLQDFIDDELDLSSCAEVSLEEWMHTLRNEDDFSNVPLHLKMLADNLFQSRWQILNLRNTGMFEIYTQFVERTMKIYRENKSTTQSGNPADRELAELANPIIGKIHHELAVKTLFPHKRYLPDINVSKEYTNTNDIMARMGLVKTYGLHMEFVHRTYAEYFFSEYLSMHLENPTAQSELLPDILIYDQYFLVRIFFDGFLSKNELKSCSPKVLNEIMKLQNDRGETVLHLVSSSGLEHIRAFVLSNTDRKNNAVDMLLKLENEETTVSDVEAWEENADICDIIMEQVQQNPNLLKQLQKFDDKGRIAMNSPAIVENREVRDILTKTAKEHQNIIKHMLFKCTHTGYTALHAAAYNDNIQVCKLIMSIVLNNFDEFNEILFKCDREGHSALHIASFTGKIEICNIILNATTKYEHVFSKLMCICDVEGRNAFYVAAFHDKKDICEIISTKLKEYPHLFKKVMMMGGKEGLNVLHVSAVRDETGICEVILRAAKEYPDILKDSLMMADYEGRSILHSVIESGKIEICHLILNTITDNDEILKDLLMKCDKDGRTCLHIAALKYNIKMCESIVKFVQNKDLFNDFVAKPDKDGLSALHIAAERGFTYVCRTLLEIFKQYPNVLERLMLMSNKEGCNILSTEATNKKVEIFNIILETCSNHPEILKKFILMSDYYGLSAFHKTVLSGKKELCDSILGYVAQYEEIMEEMLMKCDAEGNSILCVVARKNIEEVGESIFHYIEGKPEVVKTLTMLCDAEGNTALHIAAERGHSRICSVILRYVSKQTDLFKVLLTKGDKDGNTCLHLAAQRGNKEACEEILQICKCEVDILRDLALKGDREGDTALHVGARKNCKDVCDAILGAVLDEPSLFKVLILKGDKEGNTALHVAAQNGYGEVCETILTTGRPQPGVLKDLILKGDKDGNTALHTAAGGGYSEACDAILKNSKYQSDVYKELLMKGDKVGSTALHVAAQRGFQAVCEIFLKNGEDHPDIMNVVLALGDKYGRAPLSYL